MLQEVTEGYKGFTRGYRGNERLQGVTEGYKGLQGLRRVTAGYKRLQGVTGGYRGLQGVTSFLKSKSLKQLMLSAKSHSKETRTTLMDSLNISMFLVKTLK